MMEGLIAKSDYDEALRLPEMEAAITRVPLGRIIEKLDSYLERNDYAAAERHLRYWLDEAKAGNDDRGRLSLLGEQIGLCRKCGLEPEGLAAIGEALTLVEAMDIGGTVSYGTVLINAATGCKAFGKAEEALPLYRKARELYEAALPPDDERLGGLYNNMALALTELGDYAEAETLFRKALDVMARQTNGAAELAITRLNLADLYAASLGLEDGAEKIEQELALAEALLDTEGLPRDGHYAFVCEKCAPVFGYYGFFLFAEELKRRAREIYDRA